MEDPSSQTLLLQFLLLVVLTFLNAFFSAAEMAMVSLNRARVEQKAEEGDIKYIRLLQVLENPNNFFIYYSGRYYPHQYPIRGQLCWYSRSCIFKFDG